MITILDFVTHPRYCVALYMGIQIAYWPLRSHKQSVYILKHKISLHLACTNIAAIIEVQQQWLQFSQNFSINFSLRNILCVYESLEWNIMQI